ncbi:MAG: hypothetical protein WBN45_14575 [Arenicellales bacterium]
MADPTAVIVPGSAQARGLGPVLSYSGKVAGKNVIGELKWLHEFNNQNRLEGDTVFLKVMAKCWIQALQIGLGK